MAASRLGRNVSGVGSDQDYGKFNETRALVPVVVSGATELTIDDKVIAMSGQYTAKATLTRDGSQFSYTRTRPHTTKHAAALIPTIS